MKNKKGFALIESIFMIVFISVALLIVYKAFATSFQDERRRVHYDNTASLYKAYFVKQYFEENDILDYLTTATLTDGYLEIDCDTLTSVNSEYCDFLMTTNNFNIKKIYITKYDMDGVTYTNLEPTTIDYFRTLSGTDTSSYRIVFWFNDDEYASLKLGDPFYNLNVLLDGGTWNGETPQRIVNGDTVEILEPTKEGYIFTGWNVFGSGSSINGTQFTMGLENTILVAVWQRPTYNFVYNGSFQTFIAPLNGYYLIELWGAEGGSYNPSLGQQKGAYVSGYINLIKDASINIYIGGAGTTNGSGAAIPGGYNGGGTALGYSDSNNGSGGGATDIRLDSSLNSRIIVAAGGGGTVSPTVATGNYGGALLASNAVWTSGSTYTATGGTQISAGGGTVSGAFGQGANGGTTYRAGGGGGYYGGGVHTYTGSGGSSFISGYAGVNAIVSSLSTTATNDTIHYSNKYFINGVMTSGSNSGNGKAKITYAGETVPERTNTNLNNVRYIKDCINGSSANISDHWVELQAIYNGINVAKGKTVTGTVAQHSAPYAYTKIVDGDITSANYSEAISAGLQCITVDLAQAYNLDEIGIWHYYADGRTYYSNTTYVSSNNSTWTPVIANANAETSQGKRITAWGANTAVVPIYRVTNLLLDPTFSGGNTNWPNYSSTSSFTSGTANVTATAQYGGLIQNFSVATRDALKGHQVYGSAMLMANSTNVYWVAVNDSFLQQTPLLTQINTWQRLSATQLFNASSTAGLVKTQDGRASAWVIHYMKEPFLIDLTATFGAGKEPTKAWCDANINYFAGTQNLNLSP